MSDYRWSTCFAVTQRQKHYGCSCVFKNAIIVVMWIHMNVDVLCVTVRCLHIYVQQVERPVGASLLKIQREITRWRGGDAWDDCLRPVTRRRIVVWRRPPARRWCQSTRLMVPVQCRRWIRTLQVHISPVTGSSLRAYVRQKPIIYLPITSITIIGLS